jgi:hypothetical protein
MSIPIGYLPQEVKPHPLLLQLLVAQAKSAEESNLVRIQKKKMSIRNASNNGRRCTKKINA